MHRTLGRAAGFAVALLSLTVGTAGAASPAPSAGSAAVAPGEAWIVYQRNPAEAPTRIHLVRPDGSGDHPLVPDLDAGADQRVPSWSPDGSTVAFAVGTLDEAAAPSAQYRMAIWTVAADGSGAAPLITCELPCIQVAWPEYAPDGGSLAFVRYTTDPSDPDGLRYGPTSVEVLDLAAGTTSVVAATADGVTTFQRPRWSGDGTRLVATRETYPDATESAPPTTELVVLVADGSAEPAVLAGADLAPSEPDWDPAGDRIAFTRYGEDGLGAIWIATLDGAAPEALPAAWPEGSDVFLPSWDPNGGGLLVTAVTDGPPAPALVGADGTSWTPVPASDAPMVHGRLRPTS